MNNSDELLFTDECFAIKAACIEVRKRLGNGFLEKVYENAIKYELEAKGFKVESQKELDVWYKDQVVGKYFCDLVVNDAIIIELKCVSKVLGDHKSQLLNYLTATGFTLGLIINFPNDNTGFDIIRLARSKQSETKQEEC